MNFGAHFGALIEKSGGSGGRIGRLVDQGEIENYLITIGKKSGPEVFAQFVPAALSHASCECGLILGEDSQNSTVSVIVSGLLGESLPRHALTLTSWRMLTQENSRHMVVCERMLCPQEVTKHCHI